MSDMEKDFAAQEKTESKAAKSEKKADKSEKKPTKDKKKGNRVVRWFKELRAELKKVTWPTGKQTLNNTLVVIACCLIVGVFIWVFDWVAVALINALLNLFGKA